MAVQRTDIKVPGWGEAKEQTKRKRLIIASGGEEREGKTQFGFTAPGPIACFPFDNNTPELIQKWLKMKKILIPNESLDYTEATAMQEWKPIWDRFEALWKDAVNSPSIRTIMCDTGTEAYELCRLAEFGKLAEVMPTNYARVNAKFKRLIDMTYTTDKNIIFIHQLKDVYKNNNRTGERQLSGYGLIGYKVQINLRHWRLLENRDEVVGTEGFGISIVNCTQNETLAGTFLEEPSNTWQDLGQLVYPGTKYEDWL
jgi:hypothetical protein